MKAYSNSDAVRELRLILDKAPGGAVSGEWISTTEQAGVSSQSGGYRYADGSHVAEGDNIFQTVRQMVKKLEASRTLRFSRDEGLMLNNYPMLPGAGLVA